MAPSKLVADGLWQCLCPSFTTLGLSTSSAVLRQARRRSPTCLAAAVAPPRRFSSWPSRLRPLSAQRQDARQDARQNVKYNNPVKLQNAGADMAMPVFESFEGIAHPDGKPFKPDRRPKFESMTSLRTLKQKSLHDESTAILYERVRSAALRGMTRDVEDMVEHLVCDRKEAPNPRLYSALILSNVNYSEGAAWRVAAHLNEMIADGLSIDVGICHDVLKVLSVHLDHLLRSDILEYMQQHWLTLTEDGHHDVVAGLVREGQLEHAVQWLERMRKEGFSIRPWLSDLAAYTLAEHGEYHDALRLIKDQIATGHMDVSKSLWHNLLENASADYHYEVTEHCWRSQVSAGYLNPSAGTCLNVLTTASRAGDAGLATDVFHVLGKRGAVFEPIHYEQLLATYLLADPVDLHAALTVLTIMATVKLEPTVVSTRPLFEHLCKMPDQLQEAFDILVSLNNADRKIPIAALNVLIEAHVHSRDLEAALVIYKALHTFERPAKNQPHKPLATVETFNLLLRGTYRTPNQDGPHIATFLMAEMRALGIMPNSMTYDRLIIIFQHANDNDQAWRQFDEMEKLGFMPRIYTARNLAIRLASTGDERCWDILQRLSDHDMWQQRTQASVENAWTKWVTNKEKGHDPSTPSSAQAIAT